MDIGNKIRKIREIKNITRETMAEALQMSLSGYGKIESNISKPSLNKLEEISKTLDMPLSELLTFDEQQIIINTFHKENNGNGGAGIIINETDQFDKERALYEQLIASLREQIEVLKGNKME
ncbi:MAG: helix-turn-helix transcriptional regulator [Bacteroidetes bacterium]|nr:helix-turn-helix transcriptional regulator [Bacteroidota bacterium]